VKEISFTISAGEMVGFLGPNGAGKSTTLKMLTGVLHPTAGEATILGFTPWKMRKKYVGRIGAVFGQKSQLLWDIPPLDAFHMNKAIYNIPEEAFERTLDELVTLLSAEDIIRKPTRVLSLGERMKCEFIMAMLHEPEIVFLDEPTIGLDVIAKENIRTFIREMNRKGVTFILTTHDLDDIEKLAQRVIVINHGEIIFDNKLERLKSHLGDKKLVKITAERPIEHFQLLGVTVVKQPSAAEIEVEIDLSLTTMAPFMQLFQGGNAIRDMTVQELPIESVMRSLYVQGL
jgi:ABC-2 type transport system ATP-binding protein